MCSSRYTRIMSTVFLNSGVRTVRINTLLLALILTVRAASQVEALPLRAFLDPTLSARLAEAEVIRHSSSGKDAGLMMAPDHHAAKDIRLAVAAENPDIIVEALFLWRAPDETFPLEGTLAVYNVLRSISTLQGIEYYSASRKKFRLLYEYSSLITGPEDQTPIQDTRLDRLPLSSETLYARQRDLTFGDNRYRILLSYGSDYFTEHSTNLTNLSLGIIPLAGPGAVHVRLLVVRVDEGLLFYVASSARVALIPGVRSKLETSFGNRATAVYNWFSRELIATWPKIP